MGVLHTGLTVILTVTEGLLLFIANGHCLLHISMLPVISFFSPYCPRPALSAVVQMVIGVLQASLLLMLLYYYY